MIKFFLLVFLSSSSALALSLLEAVDLALQNSNAFKQSKYDLEKAELAVIQSRAAFLPSLDLTAGYSYNYENPRFLEYEWVSGASLALSQNIYDHGVSRLKYESAEGRRKLAQLDFKRVKSETIVQTARLYFEVLKTAFIEDLQDKNILQVEKVYKLISAQYKQGLRTRQDFLRFESQYQRALVSQTSAQLDALRAKEDLKSFLQLPQLPATLENYRGRQPMARDGGEIYEVERKKLSLAFRESEEGLAKVENRPQLDLIGKLGYGSDSYYQTGSRWADNDKSFLTVGLAFNWNLWDWGQRAAAVKRERIETLKAESETSFAEQEALAAIAKLEKQVEVLQRQYEITENYNFTERDLRQGQATYLVYSASLSDLISSKIQGIQTEYNLILAQLELRHRKGFLDESIIK